MCGIWHFENAFDAGMGAGKNDLCCRHNMRYHPSNIHQRFPWYPFYIWKCILCHVNALSGLKSMRLIILIDLLCIALTGLLIYLRVGNLGMGIVACPGSFFKGA